MDKFNVWIKKPKVAIFIGGNPQKGQAPVITGEMDNPQIIIDKIKNTITIVETK